MSSYFGSITAFNQKPSEIKIKVVKRGLNEWVNIQCGVVGAILVIHTEFESMSARMTLEAIIEKAQAAIKELE